MKKIFLILIIILNYETLYAKDKIAYIDINHILNNSIVGQSISEHIQKIKENKKSEFDLVEKKLLEKENNIIKKKNIINQNEFDSQVNLLRDEINNYKTLRKNFNKEIDKKKIKYTKDVLATLNQIISKYVEENSITIVFPKKSIIIAKTNLNITDPVLKLLNDQLKKIDF